MRKRLYVSLLTYSFFVILFNIINGGFVLTEEMLLDIPAEHEKNVCGSFDVFLKKIEKALSVDIIERDGAVKILGEAPSVKRAGAVLKSLVELSERGSEINEQQVDYVLETRPRISWSLTGRSLPEASPESPSSRRLWGRRTMWI